MAHPNPFLNNLIGSEVDKLIHNRSNFVRSELMRALMRNATLRAEFGRLRKRGSVLEPDELMKQGLEVRVSRYLRRKDRLGFRLFDSCKPDGSPTWLWFKMSCITRAQLELLISALNVREHSLRLKRGRYKLFADRLAQLEEDTMLGEIYDDVAPIAARFSCR